MDDRRGPFPHTAKAEPQRLGDPDDHDGGGEHGLLEVGKLDSKKPNINVQ